MREVWFESGGARLFAVEDGGGRVLVMLHRGMGSHRASLPLIVPLIRRYRVIAPDLRGSGRATFLASRRRSLGSLMLGVAAGTGFDPAHDRFEFVSIEC